MPKVSNDDLKAFGQAVQRARSLRGWTLDQLGNAIDPPVGKSLVSKIEKGRKDTLNSRTVGRFIKALNLDENWIDKFLHVDTTDDGDETKAERDADIIIDRALREDVTEGASEELLIQLANTYAEGTHKDRDTAYNSVRNALAAYARLKSAGLGDNSADALHNAIMAEVTALNDAGELDNAEAKLEDAERAMKAAHQDEEKRKDQQITNMLNNRIAQDRLRDRPDLAADRLIQNTRDHREGGTLFDTISKKADEWSEQGNKDGDLFTLQVALNIAKTNYETNKKKSGLTALALNSLGWSHLRLAERSSNQHHL